MRQSQGRPLLSGRGVTQNRKFPRSNPDLRLRCVPAVLSRTARNNLTDSTDGNDTWNRAGTLRLKQHITILHSSIKNLVSFSLAVGARHNIPPTRRQTRRPISAPIRTSAPSDSEDLKAGRPKPAAYFFGDCVAAPNSATKTSACR
jgi:hypothetical protein